MALERLSESDEDYDPTISNNYDDSSDEDDVSTDSRPAPVHPVPAMQEAFEESIREANGEEVGDDTAIANPNAEIRRKELLDLETYDESWKTRWKQPHSARCHPLAKLMAQIIFGMHLLHQQQAKSDSEVVKILQTHVDDIDSFLEKTTEDFDLAMKDIEERIGFLKLPMTHLEVFDVMLDDKTFRNALVDGNYKIEKIIERTARAMNAAMLDVQKGVNTTCQLAQYLDTVSPTWPHNTDEQSAILTAMCGNEEGWRGCLRELQTKGNALGVALVQLGAVVGEISKLAATASRRQKVKKNVAAKNSKDSLAPRSKYSNGGQKPQQQLPGHNKTKSISSINKPLPKDPDPLGQAVKATIPKSRSLPLDSKYENPRENPPTPPRTGSQRLWSCEVQPPSRPTTKLSRMEPREPCSSMRSQTKDLAGFLKHSTPPERTSQPPLHSVQPASEPSKTSSDVAPQFRQRTSILQSRKNSEQAIEPLQNPKNSTGSTDSAYFSGSDLQYEKASTATPLIPSRTPSRMGLFPGTNPTTPRLKSRTNSTDMLSHRANTTPPHHGYVSYGYANSRPPSTFSIRKLLGRRERSDSVRF